VVDFYCIEDLRIVLKLVKLSPFDLGIKSAPPTFGRGTRIRVAGSADQNEIVSHKTKVFARSNSGATCSSIIRLQKAEVTDNPFFQFFGMLQGEHIRS
jgi:hypothetical protein